MLFGSNVFIIVCENRNYVAIRIDADDIVNNDIIFEPVVKRAFVVEVLTSVVLVADNFFSGNLKKIISSEVS